MNDWIDALAAVHARDEPCVLVTLAAIEGSSPREPGAKMIVTAEGSEGTLGGGTVELRAQEQARAILAAGPEASEGPVLEAYTLDDAVDQACGGRMRLLFEPLWTEGLRIGLFGAGHVGRALVRLLAELPCRVRWVDSRPGMFPETVPGNVEAVTAAAPAEEVDRLVDGAFVIAMTHSHDMDLDIVEAALRSGRFPFVGTIGSKTKRGRFRHRLAERGLAPEVVDRLVIPIGVPGVGGKRPAEIAVAVAAQLLQQRDSA
ncbi:MAG: xanthine dehydrogenase accessory protein XdhC [Arhodomonas sp.]|nr:xanthine dehydrogenase accessory protein XdhC [Arhodomonas sp.]